jgi:uncharacterized protein (DUF362 family)/ferredoxin
MGRPKVAIVRCGDYTPENVERAVADSLALIGGMERFVQPGQRVLLKPNLLSPFPPERGVTTHPAVVAAVAKLGKEAGGELWLGDSSGGITFTTTERALDICGMRAVGERFGARVINFEKESSVPATGKVFRSFNVAEAVRDADVVISLPRLKNHGEAVITGAVKNMYGAVPGSGKPGGHQAGNTPALFGEVVVDVYEAATPTFAVMDAVIGMEGDGPAHGRLRHAGYIIAADDPVALDIVMARLLGYKTEHIPALVSAARRGISPGFDGVKLLGETRARVPNWKPTSTFNRFFVSLGKLRPLNDVFWDLQKVKPKIDKDLCEKCRVCVDSCPVEAIDMADYPEIDDERCIYCYCCHELCPHGAVELQSHWLVRTLCRGWRGSK